MLMEQLIGDKESRDIFQIIFKVARKSLLNSDSAADSNDIEEDLNRPLISNINSHIEKRLLFLKSRNALVKTKFSYLIDFLDKASLQIHAASAAYQSSCFQQKNIAEYRLSQQQQIADRRLQELIYEVLGEYGKAFERANRREEYLAEAGQSILILKTWHYLWEMFLLRLKADICANNSIGMNKSKLKVTQLLIQPSYSIEFNSLIKKVNKKIGIVSNESFVPVSICKFSKNAIRIANSTTDGKSAANAFVNSSIIFARTANELVGIMNVLEMWASQGISQPTSSARPASASNRPQSSRVAAIKSMQLSIRDTYRSTVITNQPIEWLRPSSYCAELWDKISQYQSGGVSIALSSSEDVSKRLAFAKSFQCQHSSALFNSHVYFCLEERSLVSKRDALRYSNAGLTDEIENKHIYVDLCTTLQEIYADYPNTEATIGHQLLQSSISSDELHALRKALKVEPFVVLQYKDMHRDKNSVKLKRKDAQVQELLLGFPDVVCAQSLTSGLRVHFAPAHLLNLDEAQIDEASHSLGGGKGLALGLYCIATSQNVCQDFVMSSKAETGRSTKQKRPYMLVMFPLVETLVETLVKFYSDKDNSFFSVSKPARNRATDDVESAVPAATAAASDTRKHSRWNCLKLLPDNYKQRTTISEASLAAGSNKPHKLNHKYVLFADENSFDLENPVDSSGNKLVQQCFYLLQLHSVMQGEKQRGDVSSSSDVFLTEESMSGNHSNGGGVRGASETEQEEDVLVECIKEEYLSQLKSDLLISATNAKSTESRVGSLSAANALTTAQEEAAESSASAKREWDVTIMSRLCYWRSCLCMSQADAATSTKRVLLCAYHRELKEFLDTKLSKAGVLESSKYLPKKPPALNNAAAEGMNESKRDLLMIRAASTLLQELWDGRLKSTVKLFSKKVVSDVKFKSFLEGNSQLFAKYYKKQMQERARSKYFASEEKLVPSAPTWSLWKNADYLQNTLKGLNSSLDLLRAILAAEQYISREIDGFVGMSVFPSQELLLIRREIKNFKDLQEELVSQVDKTGQGSKQALGIQSMTENYESLIAVLYEERKLCDKKLVLLSQRREMEEEARNSHLRRIAKQRAAEEVQSRDPGNFKNQPNRFS